MAGYEDFVHLSYRPKETDLICSFKVTVPSWEKPKRAIGAVASESSVGTWAGTKALQYKHVQDVAGRVFDIKPITKQKRAYWIKVAYPQAHFEAGNMSQILASIAGNIFDMKAVGSLRLQDIKWPKMIKKSFKGPQFGIKGVRKILGVKNRPIMLSVAKPKVGMTTKEHVKVGFDIWRGGLDLLKDDENLSNQKFNPFERRVRESLKARDKAEKITGERKSYLINVTGPTVEEMIRRAKFVKKMGGEYVMVDIITAGWAALNSLRYACQDLGLAIHAHRAMHGAMTRNLDHGFSMLCVAEAARLIGVDQLHIGTAGIGKMVGSREEVLELEEHIIEEQKRLKGDLISAHPNLHCLDEDWYGIKPVLPVASGGLHPVIMGEVLDEMGTDIALQIGGGVHGHPNGSYGGAMAMRQAWEAYEDGVSPEEYAKSNKELALAVKKWGRMRPR